MADNVIGWGTAVDMMSSGGLSCEEAEDNNDWRQNENESQGDNWLSLVDVSVWRYYVFVNTEGP